MTKFQKKTCSGKLQTHQKPDEVQQMTVMDIICPTQIQSLSEVIMLHMEALSGLVLSSRLCTLAKGVRVLPSHQPTSSFEHLSMDQASQPPAVLPPRVCHRMSTHVQQDMVITLAPPCMSAPVPCFLDEKQCDNMPQEMTLFDA